MLIIHVTELYNAGEKQCLLLNENLSTIVIKIRKQSKFIISFSTIGCKLKERRSLKVF